MYVGPTDTSAMSRLAAVPTQSNTLCIFLILICTSYLGMHCRAGVCLG